VFGLGSSEKDDWESIKDLESPSLIERLSQMTLDVDDFTLACREVLTYDLEWANLNGELLFATLKELKSFLPNCKKTASKDICKKAIEHLDGLSKRATSSSRPLTS